MKRAARGVMMKSLFLIATLLFLVSLCAVSPAQTIDREKLIEEGYTLFLQGKYEESLRLYNLAGDIDRSDMRVYFARGVIFEHQKKYDEALREFSFIIEMDPSSAAAYNNMGWIYFLQGRYDKAIEALSSSVSLDPSNPRSYNNLAILFLRLQRPDLAKNILDILLEKQKNNYAAHTNMGLVYEALGNSEMARQEYEQALALNARGIEAMVNLGNVYYDLLLPGKAMELWEKALELDPGNPSALVNRGKLYFESGKREQAALLWEKAIEKMPDNITANDFLAQYLVQRGDLSKALLCYERIKASADGDPRFHSNRGWLYYLSGNYEEARKEYLRALEIEPDNELALINLGLLDERLGRNDEAFGSYMKILLSNPDSLPAHLSLCRFYLRRSSYREALTHMSLLLGSEMKEKVCDEIMSLSESSLQQLDRTLKDSDMLQAGQQQCAFLSYCIARAFTRYHYFDRAGEYLHRAFELDRRLKARYEKDTEFRTFREKFPAFHQYIRRFFRR